MNNKPRNPKAVPDGIDLRDWFAGLAMQGLCANSGGPSQANNMSGWGIVNCDVEDVASQSYQIADAMLAERERNYD